jgi:uncharacterized protein
VEGARGSAATDAPVRLQRRVSRPTIVRHLAVPALCRSEYTPLVGEGSSSPATLRVAACLAVGLATALHASPGAGQGKTKAGKESCKQACMVAIEDACCPPVVHESSRHLPESGCHDVAACAAACNGGDAVACLHAGEMSGRAPPGKGRDNAQAFVYFDKGCRLGQCRACWLGCSGSRGDYHGLPHFETALARDEADCRAGDPNSCRKVATLHREDGRYAGYEQRACDLGSAEACAALAHAYSDPVYQSVPELLGLVMTPGFSTKLVERACALGHVRSCVTVGHWRGRTPIEGLTPERVVDEQWKRASDLLDPLCRRGEREACRVLGELRGELTDKPAKPAGWDASLEVKYLDHACTMGDPDGCRALGVARLRASGIKGDTRAAMAAFQRACSLGSGRGCVALSQLTPDRREAQQLIDLACDRDQRGFRGNIYTNAGLPELPQPLNCSYPRGATGRPRR